VVEFQMMCKQSHAHTYALIISPHPRRVCDIHKIVIDSNKNMNLNDNDVNVIALHKGSFKKSAEYIIKQYKGTQIFRIAKGWDKAIDYSDSGKFKPENIRENNKLSERYTQYLCLPYFTGNALSFLKDVTYHPQRIARKFVIFCDSWQQALSRAYVIVRDLFANKNDIYECLNKTETLLQLDHYECQPIAIIENETFDGMLSNIVKPAFIMCVGERCIHTDQYKVMTFMTYLECGYNFHFNLYDRKISDFCEIERKIIKP
jgi:hypothetical protein